MYDRSPGKAGSTALPCSYGAQVLHNLLSKLSANAWLSLRSWKSLREEFTVEFTMRFTKTTPGLKTHMAFTKSTLGAN